MSAIGGDHVTRNKDKLQQLIQHFRIVSEVRILSVEVTFDTDICPLTAAEACVLP